MGVSGLQKFLQTGVPNEYCWEVDVKKLADEYRNETGREPVVLIDGPNCLRSPCLRSCARDELLLGGQMQEFIKTMKNFVAAFQEIKDPNAFLLIFRLALECDSMSSK
jgi:hypothetical protein